eukprot:1162147-Pelagomonas_calceolata.AAC.16
MALPRVALVARFGVSASRSTEGRCSGSKKARLQQEDSTWIAMIRESAVMALTLVEETLTACVLHWGSGRRGQLCHALSSNKSLFTQFSP